MKHYLYSQKIKDVFSVENYQLLYFRLELFYQDGI